MKKSILFFIANSIGTEEEIAMARSIGAQIRNAALHITGQVEKCDYVAGHIPADYKEKKIFETAKELSRVVEGILDGDDSSTDDSNEIEGEVTIAKLEALTKSNLIAYAEENDIELTKDDKKNKANLVEAIAEHLEID